MDAQTQKASMILRHAGFCFLDDLVIEIHDNPQFSFWVLFCHDNAFTQIITCITIGIWRMQPLQVSKLHVIQSGIDLVQLAQIGVYLFSGDIGKGDVPGLCSHDVYSR